MQSSTVIRKSAVMSSRRLFGWAGLAGVLATLFLQTGAWPETDICGYPAKGRVAILREGATVATFSVGCNGYIPKDLYA